MGIYFMDNWQFFLHHLLLSGLREPISISERCGAQGLAASGGSRLNSGKRTKVGFSAKIETGNLLILVFTQAPPFFWKI